MKTMKTIKTYILVTAIAAVIVLAGCDTGDLPTDEISISYDLMEMRAMIPVIEAGLMVAIPDDSMGTTGFSIKTYTDPVNEPFEIYGSPVLGSTVRYPSGDAFIEDFYGTAGNRAYLELAPYEDTDLYRVDLFIYPTLSTTVDYVHEAYLVIANPEDGVEVPWALVDADGLDAPLNYLVNETVYFDGRTQTTNVEWSRYSDGLDQYYEIPAIGSRVPDDFDNALYDFPADPDSADPGKAAAGAGLYSAKSVSTIPDQGTTATEYYTDSDPEADGNYEIFSVSYVDRNDEITLKKKALTITEQTVRRYYQDVNGNKTVRARTEAGMDYDGLSSSTIVTESVEITDNGTNPITLDSVISAFKADDELYVITIDLDETGVGTNVFSGTMVNEMADRQPVTYEITLSTTSGLTVRAAGDRKTQGNFDNFSRNEFKDMVFDLSNGGNFKGKMNGGAIQGIYTQLTEEADVYLSLAILLGVSDSQTAAR
jgi:hypothetical protein